MWQSEDLGIMPNLQYKFDPERIRCGDGVVGLSEDEIRKVRYDLILE